MNTSTERSPSDLDRTDQPRSARVSSSYRHLHPRPLCALVKASHPGVHACPHLRSETNRKPAICVPIRGLFFGEPMSHKRLSVGAVALTMFGAAAQAQQTRYPKPAELPNPYRLVEGWPTLPASMNGGHWGEVIRVHVSSDGNIWVFHRCFNTVPPGHATCIGRGDSNPPILKFDPSGKLLTSFGVRTCSSVLTASPSTETETFGSAT